jgi:hypothetical protein
MIEKIFHLIEPNKMIIVNSLDRRYMTEEKFKMKTPLVPIQILSIYKDQSGNLLPLPSRMACCTPDTSHAISGIAGDLANLGGRLILSDLFRSYEMQLQSHNDYLSGKKTAFSPPPGGSFHEAGRAFDLDLGAIHISLSDFWEIAAKYDILPIIKQPDPTISEAWHFDCRGSHQAVYQYYANGKGNNFAPYAAAAVSAILSDGIEVDFFGPNQTQAALQCCLIRLGSEIGNIDGIIGLRTQQGLTELNIPFEPDNLSDMLSRAESLVQEKFPAEFTVPETVKP